VTDRFFPNPLPTTYAATALSEITVFPSFCTNHRIFGTSIQKLKGAKTFCSLAGFS